MERYFESNGCEIIENHPGYLTVQLTIEMDKELMNRPFYWHYLEKTGGVPNPMKLTLITNNQLAPDDIIGETIHFGSPRLHQIFGSAKNLAGHIRLYEEHKPPAGTQAALMPWLCMNLKISYQCDRKKDIFKSIGIQLISGQLIEGFHEKLVNIQLTPKIPDHTFTLSPLIMPVSGISRVEAYLKTELKSEDHSWADAAKERWKKDLDLLNHFYEEDNENENYEVERRALQEQYEPKINISVVNGGVFYLTSEAV
nr:YqhG family protein [Mesobacillus harenae]